MWLVSMWMVMFLRSDLVRAGEKTGTPISGGSSSLSMGVAQKKSAVMSVIRYTKESDESGN